MCSAASLSYLSFADDIVVFTDGSFSLLTGTLDVFRVFAQMSGLLSMLLNQQFLQQGGGSVHSKLQQQLAVLPSQPYPLSTLD